MAPLLNLLLIDGIWVNVRWIVTHALGEDFAFVHTYFLLLLYCFAVKLFQISSLSQVYSLHLLAEWQQLQWQLAHLRVLRDVVRKFVQLDGCRFLFTAAV